MEIIIAIAMLTGVFCYYQNNNKYKIKAEDK